MPRRTLHAVNMVDRIAHAIAEADDRGFQVDPARHRRPAIAALQPLASPTEAMIDAAHQAARSTTPGPSTTAATSSAP
jgi:hypothetical protein